MKNIKLFEAFAEAYAKEQTAKREREELGEKIKAFMKKEKVEKAQIPSGRFVFFTSVRYTYSEAVKKLQEKEKKAGIAKPFKVETLQYNPFAQ